MILLVEDHDKIRASMLARLGDAGYEAKGLGSFHEALDFYQQGAHPHLMLLDMRLGNESGLALLRRLEELGLHVPTIIVSGEATISETVEAMRLGVYDFLEKPVSGHRLLRTVANCLEHHRLKDKVADLLSRLGRKDELLGDSQPMRHLKSGIARVAPTTGRVLIRGESGTGKELVANLIHRSSKCANGPFVKINCAAIPAHLIEDELFGHVRGAFTDARSDKPGLFEEAHGGTLFLDEIGDMDGALQTRLLRVLEDGMVRRIGDRRDRKVDVRVICATHRDLEHMSQSGDFRGDLYFRIGGLPLEIPPLRERGEDIAMLFSHYLDHFATRHQVRRKQVDASVFATITQYAWPGNVRELRNLCERLVILGGDPIRESHLPSSMFAGNDSMEAALVPQSLLGAGLSLREFRAQCEKEYIEATLLRTNDNYAEAAKLLGIQRTYLYQKAATLGIRQNGVE